MQKADVVKWIDFWDEILRSYNGDGGYQSEVRKKEHEFLEKVGLNNGEIY